MKVLPNKGFSHTLNSLARKQGFIITSAESEIAGHNNQFDLHFYRTKTDRSGLTQLTGKQAFSRLQAGICGHKGSASDKKQTNY
ncbi:MAG: hypothetical protein M9898_12700 [Chitinophagaceae bacterium]|nr:hypothetical protein [Chitinophagaceae bacterium]